MAPFSNLTAQVAPMGEVSRVAQQEQEHALMRQQSMQVAAQNGKEQREIKAVETNDPARKVRRDENSPHGQSGGNKKNPAQNKKAAKAAAGHDLDVPGASELWSGNILNIKI